MTKDGKLSARERDTLLRAIRILDAWIERQESEGKTSDNSFQVHDAYEAIYFLDEFAYDWKERFGIERQEAEGKTCDNSFQVHDAYEAIYSLDEFAYQTRGE